MKLPEWERSPLSLKLIEDLVKRATDGVSEILYLPETTSTNQIAKEYLESGRSDFAVVTDFQTAGKGRLNRIWQASKESSLLLTLAFKLKNITNIGWLNLWAATIARRVLMENFNVEVKLKWPNDLVVATDDSFLKFGGILSQLYKDHVIFGVGINYSQEQAELPIASATSLKLQNVNFLPREYLIADLISSFYNSWDLDTESVEFPAKSVVREYQAASYSIGREVLAMLPNGEEIRGLAVALAENGALLVRKANGEVTTITAGDVN